MKGASRTTVRPIGLFFAGLLAVASDVASATTATANTHHPHHSHPAAKAAVAHVANDHAVAPTAAAGSAAATAASTTPGPATVTATAATAATTATASDSPAAAYAKDPEAVRRGRLIFVGTCGAYCHGIHGGTRGDVPDLFDCEWKHGGMDADIFHTIATGVPGTRMVGFKDSFPEKEVDVWKVVAFLRANSNCKQP